MTILARKLSRTKPSGLLVGGLFLVALMVGVGFNSVYASQSDLLDYYGAVPPAAARSVTAIPGNAQATIHWLTPATNGGAPITGYVVTPYIGLFRFAPQSFASAATTEVITGLTNGKTYLFRVAAINPIGMGVASVASVAVTVGAPTPPLAPVAGPGKNQARLAWSAPASNNGSPIKGYVVTPYIAGKAQPLKAYVGAGRSQLILGLLDGRTYTFRVAAKNAVGTGPQSTASAPILVAGLPGPPSGVRAVRGAAGQLRVTFVAPAANGAAISSYSVTCTSTNDGVAKTTTGAKSPVIVTGLSPGHTYTCKVTATNIRGSGLSSSKSGAVKA